MSVLTQVARNPSNNVQPVRGINYPFRTGNFKYYPYHKRDMPLLTLHIACYMCKECMCSRYNKMGVEACFKTKMHAKWVFIFECLRGTEILCKR